MSNRVIDVFNKQKNSAEKAPYASEPDSHRHSHSSQHLSHPTGKDL